MAGNSIPALQIIGRGRLRRLEEVARRGFANRACKKLRCYRTSRWVSKEIPCENPMRIFFGQKFFSSKVNIVQIYLNVTRRSCYVDSYATRPFFFLYFKRRLSNAGSVPSRISTAARLIRVSSMDPEKKSKSCLPFFLSIETWMICSASATRFGLCVTRMIWRRFLACLINVTRIS